MIIRHVFRTNESALAFSQCSETQKRGVAESVQIDILSQPSVNNTANEDIDEGAGK